MPKLLNNYSREDICDVIPCCSPYTGFLVQRKRREEKIKFQKSNRSGSTTGATSVQVYMA